MLRLPLTAAFLLALVPPLDAGAGDVFVLDRASAAPNDRVTVRADTPKPVRLYLAPGDAADRVRSRSDRRLSLVGSVAPTGSLTFSVPPLDPGTYRLVLWCGRCEGARLRPTPARLRIRPTASCPVTKPNGNAPPGQPRTVSWHGNGFLWAGLDRDGTLTAKPDQVEPDGSIVDKLLWVTTPPWAKPTVTGERIDADAPPLRVVRVNTGSFSGAANASHMTPVGFPTAGCWRLTARLGDLSLTYVVRVVLPG